MMKPYQGAATSQPLGGRVRDANATAGATANEQQQDRMRAILRKRAERLARPPEARRAETSLTACLLVSVGGETYGLELAHIAQVLAETKVTPVPGAADAVLGVANLRGEVRTVLDLNRLLQASARDKEGKHYVLLLRNGERRLAVLVESVEGVRQLPLGELSVYPETSDGNVARYVVGVTQCNVNIINTDQVFSY